MNDSDTVTSIVPRLPPAIDGVGDYALNLACQLRQDFQMQSHFIVGDPTWLDATQIEAFPVSTAKVRSAESLLSLLPNTFHKPATVLLHYVGYGYAKKGCPLWLIEGLERWKTSTVNTRLVTMFHEVYAVGPPWHSVFWLSPLQKNLAARLARLSDHCLTSKQGYAKTLHQLSLGQQGKILTLPVFSTIGEPNQIPPLVKRSRRLVVFGQCANRLRVYQKSLKILARSCQELEIEEIYDIGSPISLNISEVDGVPITCLGKRTAQEISTILLNSLAGFLNYPTEYLAKSTIFAAYCAHGLIPVSGLYKASSADGLEPGKHYWLAARQEKKLSWAERETIADNAYIWYQTHNLAKQARIVFEHLNDNPSDFERQLLD